MATNGQNRISVALCTYNGERFLPQQLASMANQTRPPDELIVCDDRSSDRTIGIIREFAASATYPVKIFENKSNLGSAANFERAIRLCAGNLIAPTRKRVWFSPMPTSSMMRAS
jgi:glycosyltransferase involved in cell wall biosynthesis